jgi:ketosteroid isomerase-like protein
LTEHANAALVRRAYEAFAAGDLDTASAMFDPRAVVHATLRNPAAGEYHGPEGAMAFLQRLHEASGGTFRAELKEVLASDAYVVAIEDASLERDGESWSAQDVSVYRIDGGRVVEWWPLSGDPYGVDALLNRP